MRIRANNYDCYGARNTRPGVGVRYMAPAVARDSGPIHERPTDARDGAPRWDVNETRVSIQPFTNIGAARRAVHLSADARNETNVYPPTAR